MFGSRQRSILPLVAQGLTDQEIADKLGISKAYVMSRLQSVYNRLELRVGPNRRVLAAVWWTENGPSQLDPLGAGAKGDN